MIGVIDTTSSMLQARVMFCVHRQLHDNTGWTQDCLLIFEVEYYIPSCSFNSRSSFSLISVAMTVAPSLAQAYIADQTRVNK